MNSIIERCIENSYDRKNFVDLVKNIIYFEDTSSCSLPLNNSKNVGAFYELGKERLKDGKSFSVLEVHLKDVELDKSPVYQAKFVADFLKKELVDFAIVSYCKDEESFWKFALVYIDIKKENEKLVVQKSDPRRYYFVVGSGVPIHTAESQISQLYGKDNTFADILDAFSLEKVTKSFYQEVARKFYELVGGKTYVNGGEVSYGNGVLAIPGNNFEKKKSFAIRLLDRLIFCWFLKKKKSTNGLPLIDDTILSSSAVSNYKSDISGVQFYGSYYHDILERLFFEVMNKPREPSGKANKNEKEFDNVPFLNVKEFNNVPFLNGGLFEPKNDDYYQFEGNSCTSKYVNTLKIPDEWFEALFSVFERYNFTVDENTPVDVELSVEPEMLGRIFENLLAELIEETGEIARKSSGSYYTPREIVEYMVNESLKHYLLENTSIPEDKIDSLLSYYQDVELSIEERKEIIEALNQLKVIDPACGSGAFPIGMLQKELLILQKVDPDNSLWLDENLNSILDVALREELRNKFETEELNYMRKLSLIKNSIYGVDIQPMATEIAKLRAFLTLIVDAKVDDTKPNRGIEPLPNLEFKFVSANSLIDVEFFEKELKQQSSGSLIKDDFFEKFGELTSQYFIESDFDKKRELQHKIETLIDKKVDEKLDEIANLTSSLDPTKSYIRKSQNEKVIYDLNFQSNLWSSYKNIFKGDNPVGFFNPKYFFPEARDGFDIVIANPPYIDSENMSRNNAVLRELYARFFQSAKGNWDIFVLFIERGLFLLREKGFISHIVPNKLTGAKYSEKIREILQKYCVIEIRDYSSVKVFKNQSVYPVIFLIQNSSYKDYVVISKMESLTEAIITNKIPQYLFYRDIYWGRYFVSTETLQIIFKISRYPSLKSYFLEINSASTVSEAYKLKKYIKEYDQSVHGSFKKFVNTGTIDPYICLWGKHKTQYIKDNYNKPIVLDSDIKKISENRLFQANTKKLIVGGLSKRMECIFDDGEYLAGKSTIIILGESELKLKFVLCLLNSSLLTFWYRIYFSSLSLANDYFQISPNTLQYVPMPEIGESQQKQFVDIANRILLLTKDDDYFENQSKQSRVKEYEHQIDQMVYKLYDLTPAEIKIIEGNIEGAYKSTLKK